jgi:hypothetical protein
LADSKAVECKIEMVPGEDGWYKKTVNPLFTSVIKVERNPMADTFDEELKYHAKKIPGPVFRGWLNFCQDVAARVKNGSEAALILFYHPEKKEWGAYPPKQDLTSVFVDFSGVSDAIERFRELNGKEWLMAGTLHSHPRGCNWPSNTDENDEEKLDGVHLIVPDWGRDWEKTVAHITSTRVRFSVKKVSGLLIDFSIPGEDPYPQEWMSQCKMEGQGSWKKRQDYYSGGDYGRSFGPSSTGTGNEFHYKGEGPKTFRMTVGGKEMNVLHSQFDTIETKTLLKRLGFSKKQRNWLVNTFTDDMNDLSSLFDDTRRVLEYVKGIRGDVSKAERETIIDRAGAACEKALEVIQDMGKRILDQAEGAPKGDGDPKEEENEKEEGGDKATTEGGKVSSNVESPSAPVGSADDMTDLRDM